MLFWTVMEELHYPLAAQAKKALKDRMEEDAQQAQLQQAQQAMAMQQMPGGAMPEQSIM